MKKLIKKISLELNKEESYSESSSSGVIAVICGLLIAVSFVVGNMI